MHASPLASISTLSLHDALPISGEARNSVPWDTLIGNAIGGDGSDIESEPSVTPDTTAVVMYTSGTTGKPKGAELDRKSTRLNSSHVAISYAVFCLKKKRNATAG